MSLCAYAGKIGATWSFSYIFLSVILMPVVSYIIGLPRLSGQTDKWVVSDVMLSNQVIRMLRPETKKKRNEILHSPPYEKKKQERDDQVEAGSEPDLSLPT